jgi:ketosteroid isomerase-like protein
MKKWILVLLSTALLSAAGVNSKEEKDVLGAMDAWKQATMKKDRAALDKLLHPDLTYSHSSGMTQTKTDVLDAVTKGKSKVEAIDFSDTTVRIYGKTALVKGTVDITNSTDGKSTKSHLSILHVWIKDGQGWQMVGRQATKLP